VVQIPLPKAAGRDRGTLGARADDVKKAGGIVAEVNAYGQSKIRHCGFMAREQKQPPSLTDGQFVVARTKPSVVDALLLTIRPISIADAVRKGHGLTK
jgi:hypothetical protein